jgi:hypothetical protein
MKDGTKSWMAFAHRDLEAAKSLLKNEYVANVVLLYLNKKETMIYASSIGS